MQSELQLWRRTWRADRRTYVGPGRVWTRARLWGLIRPNLTRPLFIIGAPRSGTTFLGRCLAAAPEFSYHFEPVATKAAAPQVYSNAWDMHIAQRYYQRVYAWLMRLHADGHLRFAEKTPQNCFLLPFLSQAFPDAQFIHLIRDGRDAALSYSKQPWLQAAAEGSGQMEPGGYPFGPYPRFWVEPQRQGEFRAVSDLHRCIWGWRRHTEAALAYGRLLPPTRYHEIRYEALVNDPAAVSAQALDFLDVVASSSRVAVLAEARRVRADSVGRWRAEFSAEQVAEVQAEAGDLLRRLGYTGLSNAG